MTTWKCEECGLINSKKGKDICQACFTKRKQNELRRISRAQRAENAIYGWIRGNCNNHKRIPIELLQLCFEMYFIKMDSWSQQLSDPLFIIDKKALSLGKDGHYPNAFGDLVLSRGDFMEWKFEIKSTYCKKRPIAIGIIEADKARNDLDDDFRGRNHPGIGFYLYDGTKCYNERMFIVQDQYAGYSSVDGHDIVQMTLDLTGSNGVLSFKSGKSADEELINYGIAFDNIDVTKHYRMDVCFWDCRYFVELIS